MHSFSPFFEIFDRFGLFWMNCVDELFQDCLDLSNFLFAWLAQFHDNTELDIIYLFCWVWVGQRCWETSDTFTSRESNTVSIFIELFLIFLKIKIHKFLLLFDLSILLCFHFVFIVELFDSFLFQRVKSISVLDQPSLFLQPLMSLILFLQVFVIHLGHQIACKDIFVFLVGKFGLSIVFT